MKAYISGLGLGALLLLGSNLAYGQKHQVNVGDDGQVVTQHQHMHAKAGHTINWRRATGGSKPWFVKFADSPCAEGSEFGSDRAKTCTIKVACKAAGDAGCKAYAYQSATGPNATLNDPDIIVDP
jgi:hypothetical protein